jgi:hypothetical protein
MIRLEFWKLYWTSKNKTACHQTWMASVNKINCLIAKTRIQWTDLWTADSLKALCSPCFQPSAHAGYAGESVIQ